MSHKKGPPGAKPGGGDRNGDVNGAVLHNYNLIRNACQVWSPVLHLLDRAIWLHFRAILDGDFTKAGKHGRVYLALLPLAIREVGR